MYSDRDLQLDVNLLTSVFPVALADALDRVVTEPTEDAPSVEASPLFAAAQAG
jgi:hypothetical protein